MVKKISVENNMFRLKNVFIEFVIFGFEYKILKWRLMYVFLMFIISYCIYLF